jgi:uncharacterized protein (DUF58 family)
MTRAGLVALIAGLLALGLGAALHWSAFGLLGTGLLLAVVIGAAIIARPSALSVERQIQPARVEKGSPAIALLHFANRGRGPVGVTVAGQQIGDTVVRTVIPRLRRGERGVRVYRLPTVARGVFDVGPVEVARADPFAFFSTTRKHGRPERLWVHPRLLPLRSQPAGSRHILEGPSSETSPAGTVTFHRLREYVPGDDLRLVHWRMSAHAGRLVVRHNVDTSQPYTVVLFDQRPSRYTAAAFEEAVDLAASVLVTAAAGKAPVELRLTDGTVVGGPRLRDTTPVLDCLTAVGSSPRGSLQASAIALRRSRGGTLLAVVTGAVAADDLPYLAGLRRRFDQVVVVSFDASRTTPVEFPGVRVIVAADAAGACAAWNLGARR